MIPVVFSIAQTADELNQKISQKNTDIDKLEKEIKQFQVQLDGLAKEKSSLSNTLKQLDLTRKKLEADISITQSKITKTNLRIEELSLGIYDSQQTISTYSSSISKQIKTQNEYELNSMVQQLLSDKKITDVWNDVDNMLLVKEKIRGKVVEVKEIKTDLEYQKIETEKAKQELVRLKTDLADQKKIVDQNTTEKKKLLAQTKNNEANYQKLLKEKIAKKDAFEKELSDYESQLKYILDASKLPGGRVLSWPVDSVYITSFFGKRTLNGVTRNHGGVDFRARTPLPAKAMADGIVAGTGDTDTQCQGVSYGKFILIKYNNGLASTYGHLSLIKVSKGDKVSRGQIVGYTGNTGSSTGPHLHLSVYPKDGVDVKSLPSKSCPGRTLTQPIAATNAYLDPMIYLPKYNQ